MSYLDSIEKWSDLNPHLQKNLMDEARNDLERSHEHPPHEIVRREVFKKKSKKWK